MKKIEIGLCASRHPLPVSEYIFGFEVDPTDFPNLEEDAYERLEKLLPDARRSVASLTNQADYTDVPVWFREVELVIYVTGLTCALIAAINAARRLNVKSITLMHYNRDTNDYLEQTVFTGLWLG